MVKEIENKAYFSVKELSEILGISRVSVFKRIKAGKIKAEKVGKSYVIEQSEIARILRSEMSEEDRERIEAAVRKTIKEYGEVLKMLGKE